MKKFAVVATIALLGAFSARADIVFDNLPPADAGASQDSLGIYGLGQSFITGPTASRVQSITVALASSNLNSSYSFTLAVASEQGGIPGNTVASILVADSSITSLTEQNFTFNSSSFFANGVLVPNSRYWVTLTSTQASAVGWWWTRSANGVGVNGTLATWYTKNSESPWAHTGTNSTAGSYQMQVVTGPVPVPEPGTMVLAGLVCGLGGVIYRRRRAARPVVA